VDANPISVPGFVEDSPGATVSADASAIDPTIDGDVTTNDNPSMTGSATHTTRAIVDPDIGHADESGGRVGKLRSS